MHNQYCEVLDKSVSNRLRQDPLQYCYDASQLISRHGAKNDESKSYGYMSMSSLPSSQYSMTVIWHRIIMLEHGGTKSVAIIGAGAAGRAISPMFANDLNLLIDHRLNHGYSVCCGEIFQKH